MLPYLKWLASAVAFSGATLVTLLLLHFTLSVGAHTNQENTKDQQ